MASNKRQEENRQNWQPKGFLRFLRSLWMIVWSLAKIAAGGVATVLFIIIVCCFVLVGAVGDYLQDDILPNVSFNLEGIKLDETSFMYYEDENDEIQLLRQINTMTDRQQVSIDEMPEHLVHAAVAIEDKRFYEHQGVDWITTVKACAGMFFGGSGAGGSTITQQLIKNLTQDNSVTVQRKVEEIFRAVKLESECDKDTIMQWYLNTIYLGKNRYGVQSAALYYFGKDVSDLNAAECACLVAITNNPSLFGPYASEKSLQRNRDRQLTILWQMNEQGWLSDEEYEEAKAYEMVFKTADQEQTSSGVDYYTWFEELVLDDVAKDLAEKDGVEWNYENKEYYLEMIKHSGYHIYATIDPQVQAYVDQIYTDLNEIPTTRSTQQLLSAIVVVDNRSGDIVAIAGSVGKKNTWDSFNHATDEGKQTGSAMKPLTVYGPAFESGAITPATVMDDLPLYYDENGKYPLNESRTYSISTSVYTAINKSLNTIAVRTVDTIGTRYSFEFGRDKFRLNGLLESEILESGRELTDIGYSPLALGALTYGVTVRDMANGYATFPNDGVWREARTYTKVYDSEGNLVLDNTQDSERILSEKAATYVNYCLRAVVTRGTGTYANLSTTAAAGKTGTTSNNRDRWFVGYTDYYTAAVWCGYKNPEQVILTGNSTNPAGRLWTKVMKLIHQDVEWKDLYSTSGMKSVTICLDTGKLATDACALDPRGDRTQSVMVFFDDAPDERCTEHTTVDWCEDGDGVCNEYCYQIEGLEIKTRGLLKFTKDRIKEIQKAGTVVGLTDELIYLVDEDGDDAEFHGLDGDLNKKIEAPYKVCTKHTEADIAPPETEPPAETEPSEPDFSLPPEPDIPGIPDVNEIR